MRQRAFDLTLFGATGYTGALVAHHLSSAQGGLRWSIAGRNEEKLRALRDQLSKDGATELPDVVVADAADRAALDRLARASRVVCSTAGPFARFGSHLVAACADAGTDYCDITGEVQWVREMIDAHDERARRSGARLVHCCGFDSIPSDLGTWALQQEMIERTGAPARSVTTYVRRLKGGMSGGTVASILAFLDAASDRALVRRIAAPYSLNPDPGYRGPDRRDARGIAYDRRIGALTLPFLMAPTNSRIVRRSHALAGFPWGHDFRYSELATAPLSLSGAARAVAITGGMGALLLAGSQPALRRLLAKRLPQPGQGPTADERAHGSFELELVGEGAGHTLRFVVSDQADPGYGSTSKMLAQAALCLAQEPRQGPGGSLTPSTAMAEPLLRRLRAAGLRFAVS